MRIRRMTRDRYLWYAGHAMVSAIGVLLIAFFPWARSGDGLLVALILCAPLPILVMGELTGPPPPKWEEEALKEMESEKHKAA
ncbi:MAG: hypothetical protein A3C11_02130 [Candidatus Sungbacteria bacterium RIFCSPHIGHO2_02_FULL_49_12]|uniref:2TM domain-containing protein n=1 Tax=Candidatus Sungbacteria bacterium RIFCSPHIGHO2_02_FULL_49_12 TaxID=1802271 RepID=A0A1G2KRH7_9BACT|nr:MAG: hypothetical protein A3C11_02130 [Candidatus Sungbacteria bacterium RIFCSPHIGHO2_02_FULL_49_12]